MSQNEEKVLLRLEGVTKHYGGVTALANVDFASSGGAIHAVLGENGAGKSTLMKIIAGVVQPDEGRIYLDGEEVKFTSPTEALRHGIGCIFQELSLLPDLSVADNIFITNPPKRFALLDRREQRRRAAALLRQIGCVDVHPSERVKDLPLSRRQMVEIAKVLGRRPRLIIMDEATSALPSKDVEPLYAVMRQLRDQGLGILYITHRMQEMNAIADTCSVFRNGRRIDTFPAASRPIAEIVSLMIGREMKHEYPAKTFPYDGAVANEATDGDRGAEEPALSVQNFQWGHALRGVSLTVRQGEIVGLGGLEGQGQTELLLALFGVLKGVSGELSVNGVRRRVTHPALAKSSKVGLALIPEDRKTQGLLLPMSISENLVLVAGPDFGTAGVINRSKERVAVQETVRRFDIRSGNLNAPVDTLSGGNQQKVIIGKWLMKNPKILLLNDPTRGIDVGTKEELYRLLRRLATDRKAILFYTTDYQELIGLCDRVAIFYGGRIVSELQGERLNEYNVLANSLNLQEQPNTTETLGGTVDAGTAGEKPVAAKREVSIARTGPWAACAALVIMFALYLTHLSRPLSIDVLTAVSNKAVVLSLIAMAQTLPVLTGGLDLSVGMTMTLSACLASVLLNGSPLHVALGVGGVLAGGLCAGLINASVIVYGRIQPIIATLATGAIYLGVALLLRPTPGGEVSDQLSDALTYNIGGVVPTTFVLLLGVFFAVWMPLKKSIVGRGCYAVGSNETAAFMSGLRIARSKFLAYSLAGVFSALAGLLLALVAQSGEASAPQAEGYTLNSIAAVVIGGTSLFGGSGGMLGSIIGAFVLRTIGDLLFAFEAPALWQPLFEGLVLLSAVCLGAVQALRKKNRLDVLA